MCGILVEVFHQRSSHTAAARIEIGATQSLFYFCFAVIGPCRCKALSGRIEFPAFGIPGVFDAHFNVILELINRYSAKGIASVELKKSFVACLLGGRSNVGAFFVDHVMPAPDVLDRSAHAR